MIYHKSTNWLSAKFEVVKGIFQNDSIKNTVNSERVVPAIIQLYKELLSSPEKKIDEASKENYDCFLFTHIPKCGGVSFRKFINESALNSGLKVAEVYIPGENHLSNNRNILQLSPTQLKRLQKRPLKVIANHSYYNTHRYYQLQRIQHPFYYTVLREPVSRWISHYNYFYYKLGYDGCKGISIKDLQEEKRIRLIKHLSNIQVKYLSGLGLGNSFKDRELLEIAKYNLLNGYAAFGILEDMQKSLNLLKQKSRIDWLNLSNKQFPKLNTNNTIDNNVPSKVLKQIKESNSLDIALYDFALRHF